MAPNAANELKNVSLVRQNKTAVVVGGTLGIGAGVARLLAKIGCARIIILGRNETRGKALLDVLKKLAPKESDIRVEFVKGDLSDSMGMNDASKKLHEAAGDAGIDYLVLTQNGTPAGHNMKDNADGHDTAFAVQAVSRFALTFLLTTHGVLAPHASVMSICNQGQTLDDIDLDDLSLKKRLAAGESATTLFMNQSKRDSVVLDCIFEEFNARYGSKYNYFSLWPGLVKTEEFDPNFAPGYLKWVMWLGIKLVGQTPDDYANYPVYLLAHPSAATTLDTQNNHFFDRKLNPAPLGKWSQDAGNRNKMWDAIRKIAAC
ncbi:hypothetical protein C8R47DRAFT_1087945 [Mycena vitilis]|nr:hypothetical protein C8R47DRAFT_1087945 [Mycena vitilis]